MATFRGYCCCTQPIFFANPMAFKCGQCEMHSQYQQQPGNFTPQMSMQNVAFNPAFFRPVSFAPITPAYSQQIGYYGAAPQPMMATSSQPAVMHHSAGRRGVKTQHNGSRVKHGRVSKPGKYSNEHRKHSNEHRKQQAERHKQTHGFKPAKVPIPCQGCTQAGGRRAQIADTHYDYECDYVTYPASRHALRNAHEQRLAAALANQSTAQPSIPPASVASAATSAVKEEKSESPRNIKRELED